MALSESQLRDAFKVHFDEMDKCERAQCYWALLHLVMVMPDICTALEHPLGNTTGEAGQRYAEWCRYWPSNVVAPKKRWEIRCALLHQGRTVLRGGDAFSYVRPQSAGSKVHEYVEPGEPIVTLDVGQLPREVREAFNQWALDLQKPESAARLGHVERHLPKLAREKPKSLPSELFPPGAVRTDITTSST